MDGLEMAEVVTAPAAGQRADERRVVGRPLRKVDAVGKVTGRTLFADDIQHRKRNS